MTNPAHITLADIAANPALARGLSAQARGELIAQCAGVLAALSAPVIADGGRATPASAPDGAARLLTARELAQQLGVKESWVASEARLGRIPRHMVGRYPRFDLAEVRQALAEKSAD